MIFPYRVIYVYAYLLTLTWSRDSTRWSLILKGFLNLDFFGLFHDRAPGFVRWKFTGARGMTCLGFNTVYILRSESSSTLSSSILRLCLGGTKGFLVFADDCELSINPERLFCTSYSVFPLLLMTAWPKEDVETGVRARDWESSSDLLPDPGSII